MKFGQATEHNKRNIFLQSSRRKRGWEAGSRSLCVFQKTLYEVKVSGLLLSFNVAIVLNLTYHEKLYITLEYWSGDMPNFYFSEKGLGLVSPPHFMYDFSRKMFLMLNSIN